MTVLFMTPVLNAPSEAWMLRMLEELGKNLGAVVISGSSKLNKWNDRVPLVSLGKPSSFAGRAMHYTGLFRESSEKILARTISRFAPTRILCQYGTYAVSFMRVWQSLDIPLFVHFHGYDATLDLRSQTDHNSIIHAQDYAANLVLLSERATYIANSEFTEQNLLRMGIPSERIVVKYLGVPLPVTGKHHTEKETITILQLGRLVDFKSPDRTIRAFEIARANGLNARLIIAGDGPLRATCELYRVRSSYSDSISIMGEVSPAMAQELIQSADIYTQHNMKGEISNQEEALGVSILEAMGSGVPVVCTRSGGVMETVLDGETGILIDPGNVDAHAAALIRLGIDTELRHNMGNAAKKRVLEKFSLKTECDRLYQILGLSNV